MNRVVQQKILNSLTVFRLVINAVKRKENATVKTRTSILKPEEKREQRGAHCAKNAVIK